MIPWNNTVKASGKLTIFMGPLAGAWTHVFREAMRDFNLLMLSHKLPISFVESKTAPGEDTGALVSVETADGSIARNYKNGSYTETLPGKGMHGRTGQMATEGQTVMEKAFIYLPTQPSVNTPQRIRPVGHGVMKVIAAHELLHACGLENDDHQSDDLFQGNPRVSLGDTPPGDKVLIGTGPRSMPPLVLGPVTVQNLKELWR
jgi:hypothetical protein